MQTRFLLLGAVLAIASSTVSSIAALEAPDTDLAPLDIPLVVDEAGDTMAGNLGFGAGQGIAFAAGTLTGDSRLSFGGNAVCVANVPAAGCASGSPSVVSSVVETDKVIGSGCTSLGPTVSVSAPAAGIVVVSADANVFVEHLSGADDYVRVVVGTTSSDCSSGFNTRADLSIPAFIPASGVANGLTSPLHITRTFPVSGGSSTYFLNGQMLSGASANDFYRGGSIVATYFPG